ncbi:MAG: dienelactone hydrolase family protein [Dehalococcoidia bacterium]
MIGRLPLAIVAVPFLAIACLLNAACDLGGGSGDGESDFFGDPGGTGPYAVGVTKMTSTRPSTADATPRAMETWIWYPAEGAAGAVTDEAPATDDGPFPLVIFSHGSGGMLENQSFFTGHLASWGFVVASPPHPGNTTDDCVLCDAQNIAASAQERPGDVAFILDEMVTLHDDGTEPLGPLVDPERTAIAGHSFGGWTAVSVAPDGQFDAAVSLAPGLPESLIPVAADVRAPVMVIAGSKDEIVPKDEVDNLYDALAVATITHYVLLPEGHHLSFIDHCLGCTDALPEARGHELINRYGTVFLKVHVTGDDRFAESLVPDPPDAELVGTD